MTRLPTPMAQLDRRMAEAGRIRMGKKTAKAMTYTDTFRFTSPDHDLLQQVADMYGGRVLPWHEPRASPADQFQLEIEAKRVLVILPPDALDQWYEKWSGGGCERRCDGQQCETVSHRGQEAELVYVPCMCMTNSLMECKPYTRLKVILPGVDMRGVWRLETKGWNALHELPGMVDMIDAIAGQGGIVRAELSIAKNEKVIAGKKKHYVVPKLELPFTPEQIVAGHANLVALLPPEEGQLALGGGFQGSGMASGPPEMDIIDAEIVSDEEVEVRECAVHYGVDPNRLWQALLTQCSDDPTRDAMDRMRIAIIKMKSGDLQPGGFDSQGKVMW